MILTMHCMLKHHFLCILLLYNLNKFFCKDNSLRVALIFSLILAFCLFVILLIIFFRPGTSVWLLFVVSISLRKVESSLLPFAFIEPCLVKNSHNSGLKIFVSVHILFLSVLDSVTIVCSWELITFLFLHISVNCFLDIKNIKVWEFWGWNCRLFLEQHLWSQSRCSS